MNQTSAPSEYRNLRSIGLLLFLLITYIIAVLSGQQLLSNIAGPVFAFGAAFVIYPRVNKRYDNVYMWLFLFAASWGMADTLWLVSVEVLGMDPVLSGMLSMFYIIPSLILVIMVSILYYCNVGKWNRYQLLLDSIVVAVMVLALKWNIISRVLEISYWDVGRLASMGVYHAADLYVVIGMIILHISTRKKGKNPGYRWVLLGVILFSINNVYFSYQYVNDHYAANSLVDIFYMLPMFVFSLGAMSQQRVRNKTGPVTYDFPENYGRLGDIRYFIAGLILLWYIQIVSAHTLILLTVLLLFHKLFSSYIQLSIKNGFLLQQQQEINSRLEKEIEIKTRDLQQAKDVLEEFSYRDKLTGLQNRRSFVDYMDQLIEGKNQVFSLFYMDLDRFKFINDAHGHEIGDRVLTHISKELLAGCGENGELFRIGGDEFAVVLKDIYSKPLLEEIAKNIIALVEEPIEITPYTFYLGISIGIARYPLDAEKRNDLMKFGDMTMYQAKNHPRKKGYLFFNQGLQREMEKKHHIEMMMKRADYDREFHLVFQPQYRLEDRQMIGLEALLRWTQPQMGNISPKDFIPIAEETGQIISIGEWVMDRALEAIKTFNEKHETNLKMAINVSPVQIQNMDFLPWIEGKLREKQVHPYWVDIEITEGATIHSDFSMEEIFVGLAKLDISASIDDFGTGYSSLSYIKRFHIDRLKIAKELVDHITEDEHSRLIIRAITMMAGGMGLKTIAEGVEETDQLKILQDMGCDEMQGYLWGKPAAMDVVEERNVIIQKAAEH